MYVLIRRRKLAAAYRLALEEIEAYRRNDGDLASVARGRPLDEREAGGIA